MHLKYSEMFAIVAHEIMKLGDNTSEYWVALTCKHEISDTELLVNCSPYFTYFPYFFVFFDNSDVVVAPTDHNKFRHLYLIHTEN